MHNILHCQKYISQQNAYNYVEGIMGSIVQQWWQVDKCSQYDTENGESMMNELDI